MNFKAISKYTVAALTTVIALASCTSNPDSPGLEYMPDMYRSPAVETYVDYGRVKGTENEDWKKKQTALTPPNSTVPYYGKDAEEVALMLPYHRKPSSIANTTHGLYGWELADSTDTEYKAAAADKNPLLVKTAEERDAMFKKGKAIYASKCQHCHGEKGNGEGPMVKSGAYAGVPDYTTLTDLADGQVFYSIYYGKGQMGAHASLVNNKEIWTLVHYVNQFRKPDYLKNLPKEGEAPIAIQTEAVDLTTVNIEEVRGQSLRLGAILYKVNSPKIDEPKSEGLKPLIDFLMSNDVVVELGAYSDTDGDDAYNLELSQKRADALKAYLVAHGITAERLYAVGHGEENPVIIDGAEVKELSRRTELKIK